MNPSFKDFSCDGDHYRTIPVTDVFYSDTLTPIQMFSSLKDDAVFLLESKAFGDPSIRFSFIGLNPFFEIVEEANRFLLKDLTFGTVGEAETFKEAFHKVTELLQVKIPDLSIPFSGGGVGYVSYEAVSDFETISLRNHSKRHPRYHFLFCETIVAFDHVEQSVTIIHFVRKNKPSYDGDLKNAYVKAEEKVREIKRIIQTRKSMQDLMLQYVDKSPEIELIHSNYEKHQFLEQVEQVKRYIRAGDIFQTVLSQRFEKEFSASGFELYRVLRQINPSPYLFYLKYQNMEIIGSSPERFVQVKNQIVEMHPIAGTRKRGATTAIDQEIARQLLRDGKERAEHVMLVDLARNDVGRVAKYGSVTVPEQLQVKYFSHVMHMVSVVQGTLRPDLHSIDAFMSAFPAGTLTGAPKIRAMEIIDELEPSARGIYGGAIVYFSFDGNMDSCIAIRTAMIQDRVIRVQAGAGIVADSDPESEYQETIHKARSLLYAVSIAEKSQLNRV